MGVGQKMRSRTRDGALLTIAAVVAAAVLARFFVVDAAVVQGKSMLPHYRNGEVVIILKAAYGLRAGSRYAVRWGRPAEGDVVAALRPDTGEMVIKRIGEIRGEPASPFYFLVGDNGLESIDSREFGPLPLNDIVGKVFPQR